MPLADETPIPIGDVSKYVTDRRISTSTTARWMTRGVRGVVLESFLIGGRRYTTREAFDRFLAAINSRPRNPDGHGFSSPRSPASGASATRRVRDVERELQSLNL